MATKNDVTGDMLISRVPSDAYKNNYDLIFGKKDKKKPEDEEKDKQQIDSQPLQS